MTSFADCVKNAVDAKEISASEGERLIRDFGSFRDRAAGASPITADAEAKAQLAAMLKAETEHKRRKAKLAMQSIQRIAGELKSYKTASGKPDIGAAALDMLEHYGQTGKGAKFTSVEGIQKTIIAAAQAKMEKGLFDFRRGAIGGDLDRHNKASLDNVAREAFGQDTGDATAKAFAKTWYETHEWLRKRFNAAGGAIGKLDDWGLPQHHDARALLKTGRDKWKADIAGRLDRSRMKHPLSGQPYSDRQFDQVLDDVYDAIVTDGQNMREPSRQPAGRGALANQRAEHRFLIFKNPDEWIAYQKDYGGGGDTFATMMQHVNMMARDIAAMEKLGPNPSGTIEWMKQAVQKQAAGQGEKAQTDANRYVKRLDEAWGSMRGDLETPVHIKGAAIGAGARNFVVASILGSASLSSVSDIGTQKIARAFAGIENSRHSKGIVTEIASAFKGATRQEAVAAGLILDSAQHVFATQARYVGTLSGDKWTSFIADRVLTYSGLTPWTQACRHAFGLAAMETYSRYAKTPFDKLPDALRNTLDRYAINADEWALIGKVPVYKSADGLPLLRQNEIRARISDQIADKYLSMILQETEYAVPSNTQRTRSYTLGTNKPGTLIGEVLRSFGMFKSFASVMVFLHGRRVHTEIASANMGKAKTQEKLITAMTGRGAQYAGGLLISTTLFGALSLQLKGIAAGRDPEDATKPNFWGRAVLQGGGLGIFGDFLLADVNRYGGGLGANLAGPVIERATDLQKLTLGNLMKLASGDETTFGKDLVKFARGNTPGSNIWYIRLAWERLVFDQLQHLADPDANKAFKRKQQFFQREWGQEYYWRPGETRPDRAPYLSAAGG